MKRVLLLHSEGNTFNNPTMKSVVDLLVENGVEVTIRYSLSNASMPPMTGVQYLPFGRIWSRVKRIVLNRLCSVWLSWVTVWFERIFLYKDYDLIIGVDRQGLIEAGFLNTMTNTPVVFFSFEIMFESETSGRFKRMERKAAKHVRHWFVQDKLRAHHLAHENNLDPEACSLIPLASLGPGVAGSNRLRDRLNVPSDKKVALVMGSLANWSMTREIILSVENWPDNWVLIVHERYGQTTDTLRILGLTDKQLPANKIYLSGQATALIDDMGEIMAGISAGIAFYEPDYSDPYTGNNLKYLGLASGKISTFLRYGVPILMNEIGLYSDLAKEHHFGIVTNNPNKIGSALPLLENSSWSKNACSYFNSNLDFAKHKGVVWKKLLGAISINNAEFAKSRS